MARPRPVFILSVLFFPYVFGSVVSVEKAETDNSRADASQDPFTSVTMAVQPGVPQSSLFSKCLAASNTFDAKFASIEVDGGAEYIRYVPDSVDLRGPLPWETLTGNYPSIFECADAAKAEDRPMFKYDGEECMVSNEIFDLNYVPMCEEQESEAVFILSTAPVGDCPRPRFILGYDNNDAVCGLVNKGPFTFDEASDFCLNAYPNNELSLYVNDFPPVTLQTVIAILTLLGYNDTNLWTAAQDTGSYWYGAYFSTSDWALGSKPIHEAPPTKAGLMDTEEGFLLQAVDKSTTAGALCANWADADDND